MSFMRSAPVRTYYGHNRSAADYDVLSIGIGVAACMLLLAWLVVWPTSRRGCKHTALMHAALIGALLVFVVTALALTCPYWQSGAVHTRTPYAPYSAREVEGQVGLHVGLRTFNVTLRGELVPEKLGPPLIEEHTPQQGSEEHVRYNEEVQWGTRQGRMGATGEYANLVNQQYRRMLGRGIPTPIGWIIDRFTHDGDGMRWGRTYRQAGYYAYVLLWVSVAMWTLTVITALVGVSVGGGWLEGSEDPCGWRTSIPSTLHPSFLLKSSLRPASLLCLCTGILQLVAALLYVCILSFSRWGDSSYVAISFDGATLHLSYGWTFWLTLVNGTGLLALGVATVRWTSLGVTDGREGEGGVVWLEDSRDGVEQAAELKAPPPGAPPLPRRATSADTSCSPSQRRFKVCSSPVADVEPEAFEVHIQLAGQRLQRPPATSTVSPTLHPSRDTSPTVSESILLSVSPPSPLVAQPHPAVPPAQLAPLQAHIKPCGGASQQESMAAQLQRRTHMRMHAALMLRRAGALPPLPPTHVPSPPQPSPPTLSRSAPALSVPSRLRAHGGNGRQ